MVAWAVGIFKQSFCTVDDPLASSWRGLVDSGVTVRYHLYADGNYLIDGDISKDVGDVETTARRYVCNPWGLAACFNGDKTLFLFDSEIKITVDVKYDTGTPFH